MNEIGLLALTTSRSLNPSDASCAAFPSQTRRHPMDRRSLFETAATLGLGALAASGLPGCALAGATQRGAKTPFNVPLTTIPSVGSEPVFPVRRIHCIGRNYAGHAREMGLTRRANRGSFSRSRPTRSRTWPLARCPTTPTRR